MPFGGRKKFGVEVLRPMDSETDTAAFVILVADDEATVRQVTVAMLAGQGYTVLTAEDGHQALRILREYPGIVDLVLCDIRMPGSERRRVAKSDRRGMA